MQYYFSSKAGPKAGSKLILTLIVTLAAILAATGGTAWAQRKLVMVGGGLEDLEGIIYNGTTPRPPGTGPAPVGDQIHSVAIYQRVLALAGQAPGSQRNIGVLTTASAAEDAAGNGAYYVDVFRYFGAGRGTEWIPVRLDASGNCAVSNADPALVKQISGMDGFFFGGGDQARILKCFFNGSGPTRTDSPIMIALRQKFLAGAVVAGTSAGTSVLVGVPMATAGESYYGLRYGIYASAGSSTTIPTGANNNPLVTTTSYYDRVSQDGGGGFGFFTEGFVDPHFSERGRQGRLIRLAWNRNILMAYGVDENTALVVQNAGTANAAMSVVGQNGVLVFDLTAASSARVSPSNAAPCSSSASSFKLCYLRTHYLTQGDGFLPATRTHTTMKPPITGSGAMIPRPSPEDVFSSPDNNGSRRNPRAFVDYAASLVRSAATSAEQSSFEGLGETRFKVCMQERSGESPAGYLGTANRALVGFRNLIVDVIPATSPCP